jgi:hypothetical protein
VVPLAELRTYCGIETSTVDAEADAVMVSLEVSAVGLLGELTGRYWGDAEVGVVYYLDGHNEVTLRLADGNLSDVSIEVRSSIAAAFSVVDPSTYTVLNVEPGTEIIRTDGDVWPLGTALVKVTADRGYGANEEPVAIRQAVKDYVNFMRAPGRNSVLSGKAAELEMIPNWTRVVETFRVPLHG